MSCGHVRRLLWAPAAVMILVALSGAHNPADASIRGGVTDTDGAALPGTRTTVAAGQRPQGAQTVSFPTNDGGIVYADVYGAGERGVVLAHGGRFTKKSWAEQAPVLAAVRYLRGTGAGTVSVVGASFGGEAAARAAVEAEPGEIDRLVLLAHSPIDEPERMQGAKLFIVARHDPYFGGTPRLVDIRDQYERAPGPKELVILEGSAHAQFIFETDQAGRLMDEMLRFLSQR